jgi:hypothetical protein
MITTGSSRRSPGTMGGKAESDDSTGGRQTQCSLHKPDAVLDASARPARAVTVRDRTTSRVLPVARPWEPCEPGSVGAHHPWTTHHAWNPSQQVRSYREPAPFGQSLPACDGMRCLAHETLVQRLGAALTIPSVSTSGNQRSTDLSVKLGLARVSASVLQGVPCACPAMSRIRADWQAKETPWQ